MINDTLHKEVEDVKEDLIKRHVELGMPASGNWVNKLKVETKNYRSIIWGEDYTEYLVSGRKPGGFPPRDVIIQWIQDKRLSYDIPITSLAFLIARKIANSGTNYFQQGGTDLIDSVVTPERIQRIINNIGNSLILEFASIIENEFKAVA